MTESNEERRKHVRRPVNMQVKYRSLDTFFYDYAINVSHGGIFIKTRRPLPRGTEVELEFEIPEAPKTFVTKGLVVRVVLPGEDEYEPSGMGIEFEPISKEDKDLIDMLWRNSVEARKDG